MQDIGSRYKISWDEIAQHVLTILAEKERVEPSNVLLPTEVQFNVIGNMYHPEWGQTNTYEWLNDKFEAGSRLIGGHSGDGGLASVYYWGSGDRGGHVGFRPLVAFPSKT